MNLFFQTVLSMSVSGALLIIGVLLINRCLRGKCSRRWQYYIWLLVIARLLLPFGPEASLMGHVSRTVNRAAAIEKDFSEQEKGENIDVDFGETVVVPAQKESMEVPLTQGKPTFLVKNHLGLIWFIVALGMLIRKIIMYHSFIKHVKTGAELVSDSFLLNGLSEAQRWTGVGKTVGLYANPQVSSPMLIGFWKPCIVLLDTNISGNDFRNTVTHELMHYKRRDILYKWLVQFAVCLHWVNPFVYVMSHEINKACEFSCDEAVLEILGYEHAADYGKTLLDAMAAAGRYKEPLTATSLSANKQILKERLSAIMSDNKKSGKIKIITAGLTVGMVLGAVFVGIYPADIAEASEAPVEPMLYDKLAWEEKSDDLDKALDEKLTEEYRTAGIVQKGKNYYYEEQLVHIFLDIHKPDERFYMLNINPAGTVNVKILREEDGKIIGAAYMTEAEVTKLLGDMNEEDASEGEAEKKKAGNESEETFPRTMIVKDRVCKIRDGAGVEFKVVGLVAEGEELTVLGSEVGSNGQLWYRLDKESLEEKPDASVESCYIRADLLRMN